MNNEKIVKKIPLIIAGTAIATFLISEFLVPLISEKTRDWGTSELAIVISIVAIIAQIAPPFIEQIFNKKNTKLYENFEHVLEKQAQYYDDVGGIIEKQDATYYAIKLDVTLLDDNNVQFEATIRNNGLITIHPRYTKLYIDQGIPGSNNISSYEFPFILEHKDTTPEGDCILCDRCKREGGANRFPIDTLEDKFKKKRVS